MSEQLLALQNITKEFDISGGLLDQLTFSEGRLSRKRACVHAVNGISLSIKEGETLSVVGESGSGKSTLARVVMGLYRPNSGEIRYRGARIDNLSAKEMRPYRTRMQMVFQDPYASLNPRIRIQQMLEEPLRFHYAHMSAGEVRDRVAAVMEQVGIAPSWGTRFPHEFSGGQRQRVSLARALVLDPEFVVADEPISALDVSIQAQILNLMLDMQEQRKLTYFFISHDLSVVRHISTSVAVMYLGTLCEWAKTDDLFVNPLHPYTQVLLSAIPAIGASKDGRVKLMGEIPSPIHLPSGCVFHGRCPHAYARCSEEVPQPQTREDGRVVACHAVAEGRL